MLKKFLTLCALLSFCISGIAKPPELNSHQTKKKIEEILKSHVSIKKLDREIISRSLSNFLDELDPMKLYLTEAEVAPDVTPSDELLDAILQEYKQESFSTYKKVYGVMLSSIERRRALEKQVDETSLPEGIRGKEFKDISWAASPNELFERLTKIRSLQLDVAATLDQGTPELFIKRIAKRRLNHEEKLLTRTNGKRYDQFLPFVIKAISSSLDNHTVYFTPQEANQFMISVQQRLFGIGAQLRDDLNGFSIMKLLDGGPAILSGELKVGDRIIAVNGEPVIGLDIIEAVELIRGPKETKVLLTMIRAQDDADDMRFDIEITRDEIVLTESRFEVNKEPYGDGVIAHIKLFSFYQDSSSSSSADIKRAIETLQEEEHLVGVVLDLRGNAGGLLTQAVAVTGLFIKKGIIVSIKDCNGQVQHLRSFNEIPVWDGPMAVLTNQASASAAEIVAQTLQDYGRALVIGNHTFGKGTYQTFTFDGSSPSKINPQGEFKVTRGMYFTVSGKSPQMIGTQVDLEIPGGLSYIDVGERFAKFPLPNSSISPNFNDDLSDIHPFHRHKLRKSYKTNRQEPIDLYGRFLPTLKANSQERIAQSENYQNFLEVLQQDEIDDEDLKPFGESDLQLDEAMNVMKDLLQLIQSENHAAAA